jgi:Tol biopolymer transport system component
MKPLAIAASLVALVCAVGLGIAQASARAVAPTYPGLIAFVDTSTGVHEIGVMRADGSQRRLLTRSLPLLGSPALSPDGKSVAVTFGNRSIALVAADGSSVRRITSPSTYDDAPTWSRDGRLAYLRLVLRTRTVSIIVADAHGRHQHVLAREPVQRGSEWLAWSSDGRDVAYGPLITPGAPSSHGRYVSIDARTGSSVVTVPPRGCTEPLARPVRATTCTGPTAIA